MAVLRRNFKVLYLLALPFCAGELILREAGQSALQQLGGLFRDPSQIDVEALIQSAPTAAAGIGFMLGSAILYQLLVVGLVGLAAGVWRGERPLAGDAFSTMASRGASLIGTGFLFLFVLFALLAVPSALVVVGGMLAGPIAAVALALLAVPSIVVGFIVLSLRWGLSTQAVVLEGRFGTGAFSRSTALMAGRGLPFFDGPKFRLSLLFLVTFAISATLQSLFAIPRLVLAAATGWSFVDGVPPLASLPLWFIVPFGLLEVATNALVMPFSSVLFTLFWFDLRVRYEGADLPPLAPPSSMSGVASPAGVPL